MAGSLRVSSFDIAAVVCGSFRRDPAALRNECHELQAAGCRVLSPLDPNFVEEHHGFAFAEHELSELPEDIEAAHLQAMQAASFVWLHAPSGYVGSSAAMELGFAHALSVPVYGREQPTDVTMASLVEVVASPAAAIQRVTDGQVDAPSRSLASLQHYYRRASTARGWDTEGPQDCLLLLTEEVGELARAMRKARRRGAGLGEHGHGTAEELADVQLYVVHLANILGVDLSAAVVAKEQVNAQRFGRVEPAVAA